MEAPSFLLPRPPFDLTPANQTAFEDLCQSTPTGGFVDYCQVYLIGCIIRPAQVSRCEAPRGELVYYIRSDGSDRPARVKVRTPTLTTLITLRDQLQDVNTADVPTVLAGVDLCIACADR